MALPVLARTATVKHACGPGVRLARFLIRWERRKRLGLKQEQRKIEASVYVCLD